MHRPRVSYVATVTHRSFAHSTSRFYARRVYIRKHDLLHSRMEALMGPCQWVTDGGHSSL